LDYKCHCGATLNYSPKDGNWSCPNGHSVYTCKKCESAKKSTPLQWIPQYQRWYCYECKDYAQSTTVKRAEEIEGYTTEIPKGSRVDEFCFLCRYLEFTQYNTHVRCGLNVPRYQEPAISDITVRPIGSGKGISSKCAQISSPSQETLMNLERWRNYIEERVAKQIENHEKVAKPVEMHRVAFIGGTATMMGQGLDFSGAKAVSVTANRDNVLGGGATVVVDKTRRNLWVHTTKDRVARGVGKFFGTVAGSIEDPLSSRYLRDLLKRDVESFTLEKIYSGEEPQEFWEAIERGAARLPDETKKETMTQPVIEGPKIEVYQIDYHLGRAYFEIYTGGRSDTNTKTMSLQPLKTSRDEFQPNRKIIVIDHHNKIVWQWLGDKVRWKSGYKSLPSQAEGLKRHLRFIGSHIGENLEDYSYMVIEEKNEPEQFKRIFNS